MSADKGLRLFVAVELPQELRSELCRWTRHAVAARQGVRRLEADSLHLTLCFLGHRRAEEVETITAVLEACAAPVGTLSLGAPVWLPRRHPRALAVEVHEESGELSALHRTIITALAAELDWEPERRSLRAHVTVARLRPDAVAAARAAVLAPTPTAAFVPETLSLYRSRLDPGGARYEALARIHLA